VIEGGVESLTADGIFAGWLRDTEATTPTTLQVRHANVQVAEAVARSFRADLLQAGHGHGHYGFAARLRVPLPPGPADFELFLPRHNQAVRLRLAVPALAPASAAPVERLFGQTFAWSVPALRKHPGCLALAAQHAAMGTARFVDVTFRFVLRRYPEAEEATVYRLALDQLRLSPEAFLLELLDGRERRDLGDALASPWDPELPYNAVPPARPARRRKGAKGAKGE